MEFGKLPEPGAQEVRFDLAAPILGQVRAAREGVSGSAGLHASEPGAKRFGREARGLALVEL